MPRLKKQSVKKQSAKKEIVRKHTPKEVTWLNKADLYFFNEGSHLRLYNKMGAHLGEHEGEKGAFFAVWAPDALQVSIIGSFNDWDSRAHPLKSRDSSGIWEGFIPGVNKGDLYKINIVSRLDQVTHQKSDPFALLNEIPPKTASVVWSNDYEWGDEKWMRVRKEKNALNAPISIYEVHFGSWRHVPEEGNRSLTYREMAPQLIEHVKNMGFTHVEFLPVMEHPFYASWGYQVTGFFAVSSRFGTPEDFMFLIDQLHQNDIGVILDWVPSHFPADPHGLARFDGTCLYEHEDPRQGLHPDWGSVIFNYGRNEVRSFLMSSAFFWLDKFHADGLRVDAVASMLYLDYSRKPGEWIPNQYGGNENLDAISFLRRLNTEVYSHFPDVQMIAEESTAWPAVSRPTYVGGLGFGFKWDMGWMNDTLTYFSKEPIHRKYHQDQITFRQLYATSENFILPLSHDEVVHGKRSLLDKMPGDGWQKYANLRLLLGYQFAQSGKKLLFMGDEFGQGAEWNHNVSIDWHETQDDFHKGVLNWTKDLNWMYRQCPALYTGDCEPHGFEWIDCHDSDSSILSFLRKDNHSDSYVLCVFNFTPVPRIDYRVGVPKGGAWKELINSDAFTYGGSGLGNLGSVNAENQPWHYRPYSLNLTLPPLACVFLRNS